MISIVTAYYNRRKLFVRTLESINFYYGKLDFEFIVVDDGSKNEERLEDLLEIYPFLRLHRIEPDKKWYSNPCIPFNVGIEMVRGEKVILQNPECYHFDPILQYVDEHLKDNSYLSFGCFSLDKSNTDNDDLFFDRKHISAVISKTKHVVKIDGGAGWYNHSKYRPSALHFCTAIMAKDLIDLGGFDPRYAWGHGFDDDELIFRIKLKNMKISFVDHFKVLHQNHYVESVSQDVKYSNLLADRNKFIYNYITKNNLFFKANYLNNPNFEQKRRRHFISMLNIFYFKLKNKLRL